VRDEGSASAGGFVKVDVTLVDHAWECPRTMHIIIGPGQALERIDPRESGVVVDADLSRDLSQVLIEGTAQCDRVGLGGEA
jgi:hypothetical protein